MKANLGNLLMFLLVLALMTGAAWGGYLLAFNNLIFPRTLVAGIEVSGLDKESAVRLLQVRFDNEPSLITLRYDGKENNRLESFRVKYDMNWAVDQAYGVGRNGNILTRVSEQLRTLYSPREITPPSKYDKDELDGIINGLEDEINREAVWPELTLKDNTVHLQQGKNGYVIKRSELEELIIQNMTIPGKHLIDIPMDIVVSQESPEQAAKAIDMAAKWVGRDLILKYKDIRETLPTEKIIKLYGLSGDRINRKTTAGLIDGLRSKFEAEAKDALLVFEDKRVKNFKPEVIGTKIDQVKLATMIEESLFSPDKNVVDIPMILTYPKITAGEINNLGIKELIGVGTSSFAHSIPGRVFNVALAASRVNGVVIAPGEEFSFDQSVGEISRSTGYQTAYVISGGKTVLGDGGGVCQVSTTVFRAALNAGLPITERKAHAYRVGYYEQDSKPGIDATVFYPSVDLKFKNDTSKHILVQTSVDSKNLKMRVEIYGTSDGRVSSVSEPKVTGQTAAPAAAYIDDPTLPLGQIKQVDFSAPGAKVSFDYKVERGGEVLFEKTFYSNYQPWQAVFMKGTKTN